MAITEEQKKKETLVFPKELLAADEIERLRAQNEKLLLFKEILQDNIDCLHNAIDSIKEVEGDIANGRSLLAGKEKEAELTASATEESSSMETGVCSRSEGVEPRQLEEEGASSSPRVNEEISSDVDSEFLDIYTQFLNDPDEFEFPKPGLLTGHKRNYLFQIGLVMKRRMRRMKADNEKRKRQLESLKKIFSCCACPAGAGVSQETKSFEDKMIQVDTILGETRSQNRIMKEVTVKESLLERKEAELEEKEATLLNKQSEMEKREMILKEQKTKQDERDKQLDERERELEETKKRLKQTEETMKREAVREREGAHSEEGDFESRVRKVIRKTENDKLNLFREEMGLAVRRELQKFERNMREMLHLEKKDATVDITERSMASDDLTQQTELSIAEMRDGPDQILEASALKTYKRTEPVKICMGDEGASAYEPVSIPTFFKQMVKKYEGDVALRFKDGGEWNDISYGEYYRQVNLAAKAFIKLRLERFQAVCLFGFNAPEWFMGHLAAISAGGIATGIYLTNGVDACAHIAEDANAKIFVVEGSREVGIIKEVEERLNKKFEIVQYCREPEYDDVYSWGNLLAIGEKESDERLEERQSLIAINQCSVLVYTSGTTGLSKGVMLNHDNITWSARASSEYLGVGPGEARVLSYLTPAHVAAMMADLYGTMATGGMVCFAQKDVMEGANLRTMLQEVQPTFFFSIPRAFEKIFEATTIHMNDVNCIRKMMIKLARSIGLKDSEMRQLGKPGRPFGYGVADKYIFQKIKQNLGLQDSKYTMSGAGPIALEIIQFFHSIGILLCETYGLSESCGPHTVGTPEAFRAGSCGAIMDGYHTKIIDPDEEGNGDILLKGRNIAMGYLHLEEETQKTVDDEGWLNTGDVGKLDSNNFLYITGRTKRLLIVAGGYNIAPEPIETKVKAKLPGVSFPVLIGDGKKFLSMILPIATDIDPESKLPLDTLAPLTIQWCRGIGSEANTIQDILEGPDEKVMKAIQEGIDEINGQAYNNQHKIQKWAILPRDFSIEGGELTPTMKVRMEVVLAKYEDIIDKIYDV